MAKETYSHGEIEPEAQRKWTESGIYAADVSDTSKDPYYLLIEFPYPSGDLHTGHWYAFAVTDIFARFKRMQGKNVLFPFGFDAFGLPAENAAIKRGIDPMKWTYENMDSMRAQVRSMGTSFDWSKEVVTCSPEYYKWTQWLFSRLYEHGLAERKEAPVKWCPHDQTVLANEQVVDGTCERCGHAVEERTLTQWFLGITKYADRLISDLDPLPWREEIKDAQRAWIGKSDGAKLAFQLRFEKDSEDDEWKDAEGNLAQLAVFTTRPDTLYGVTYLVLAPEHPWVTAVLDAQHDILTNEDKVRAYVEATKAKTERERMEGKEKTGVELKGMHALHPLTREEIPVFVADYVLGSYGTGAVMAVPAHDERDFQFAQKFGLPIKQVVAPRLVQTEEPGAFKHDEPVVVTKGIIALVEHWSEEKYLALRWKAVGWTTLMTGGMEGDDTAADTALRELREETGYTDAQVVKEYGIVDGLFYHVPKKQNRLTHGYVVKLKLGSDARETIDPEEEAKHELVWLSRDELQQQLTAATHQHALKLFFEPETVFAGSGTLINSGEFTDRESEEAMGDIVDAAAGERTTNYRLRDWLVSRQRYWGCPIPVVYDPEGKPHLVPEEHLPWLLPTDVDFQAPSGTSPLATSTELTERVTHIFGEGWTPENDTLDTFVDSSWYFMRYLAPDDAAQFSNHDLMKSWLPVDRYAGGAEHTTMHLLYSRFLYKALYDLALVPTAEPFYERFNRGLITGTDGQKMSKSKGNTINPDEYVQKYGADAVRAYLAFIGPYNEPGNYPWKPEGVESMRKFLHRCYALRAKVMDGEATAEEQKALARAATKMSVDIERFKLNTALSSLMILVNSFEDLPAISKDSYQQFLKLLAPFAPHLAEHLYSGEGSIHQQHWPKYDDSLLEEETVVIGVQVAGKRKGEMTLSPAASEEEAVAEAFKNPSIQKALPEGSPSRVIYRPGKILNLIP